MTSPRLHGLCGLGSGDVPVCCVNIGTAAKRKPTNRIWPLPLMHTSELR